MTYCEKATACVQQKNRHKKETEKVVGEKIIKRNKTIKQNVLFLEKIQLDCRELKVTAWEAGKEKAAEGVWTGRVLQVHGKRKKEQWKNWRMEARRKARRRDWIRKV